MARIAEEEIERQQADGEADEEERERYRGCRIVNIHRLFHDSPVYAELVSARGALMMLATLEHVSKVLEHRTPGPEGAK